MQCALCKTPIQGTDYKTHKRKRYHHGCHAKLVDKAEAHDGKKAGGIKKGDLDALEKYICELYKIEKLPASVAYQIESYVNRHGYSYSGIQGALYYFYELEGNSPGSHGATIGIVPHVYDEAEAFFRSLRDAAESNKGFIQEEKVERVKVRVRRVVKKRDGGNPVCDGGEIKENLNFQSGQLSKFCADNFQLRSARRKTPEEKEKEREEKEKEKREKREKREREKREKREREKRDSLQRKKEKAKMY